MRKVRMTKVSGKPDSHIATGYWAEGLMTNEPVVGERVFIFAPYGGNDSRIRTSLDEPFEWFRTSRVIKIDGDLHTTLNSVWEIKSI